MLRLWQSTCTRGEIAWKVANGGDGPIDHLLCFAGLDLPPLGSNSRAAVLVTKTLLFATEGSGRSYSASGGSHRLRAFDKLTGEQLASFELPGQITGVPMTLHDRRCAIRRDGRRDQPGTTGGAVVVSAESSRQNSATSSPSARSSRCLS